MDGDGGTDVPFISEGISKKGSEQGSFSKLNDFKYRKNCNHIRDLSCLLFQIDLLICRGKLSVLTYFVKSEALYSDLIILSIKN
ncbi:hypothetical protein BpHYR1_019193 [Brachionus plicatilis]|uniref:Uncharacterized protein n=1 Tax=Brachionus plicatilis TaxID=10195 RepID=A0A3M7S655_BRAPC|nr:hypothetical protein BpHYR1_019193 [Brachionus plicatilis]